MSIKSQEFNGRCYTIKMAVHRITRYACHVSPGLRVQTPSGHHIKAAVAIYIPACPKPEALYEAAVNINSSF
jgi:hypothetical protein